MLVAWHVLRSFPQANRSVVRRRTRTLVSSARSETIRSLRSLPLLPLVIVAATGGIELQKIGHVLLPLLRTGMDYPPDEETTQVLKGWQPLYRKTVLGVSGVVQFVLGQVDWFSPEVNRKHTPVYLLDEG